jgi:hypothetical protein
MKNLINALTLASLLGAGGILARTVVDAHDLKLKVTEQQAKLEWLYHYTFPNMGP